MLLDATFKSFSCLLVYQSKQVKMKKSITTLTLLLFLAVSTITAQDNQDNDNQDYVTFNDRNSVVHGVYLGLTMGYGKINSQDTYMGGLKLAYVANQQFEVGFVGNFFYSQQDVFNSSLSRREDLIGAYGGLHLEPILFSKSRVNLSFPLLVGAGAVGYIGNDFNDEDFEEELDKNDFDAVFVLEPGVSALFNVSRYLQLEAGMKYRFSSKIDLAQSNLDRINGLSFGIGVKVGIFNMGRNRYKKNL